MAFPLPRVVADVEPGGGIITAMKGQNALAQGELTNQEKALRNQMLAIEANNLEETLQSQSASRRAYSDLLGPQFAAKLFGNPDVLANLPISDEDKRKISNALLQAGLKGGQNVQGTQNVGAGNVPTNQNVNNLDNLTAKDLLTMLMNRINSPPQQLGSPQGREISHNAISQSPILTNEDRSAINQLQPGEAYTIPNRENNLLNEPNFYPEETYAERAGRYKGSIREGEEAGKIRAHDIKDLNDMVFSGRSLLTTTNELSDLLANPVFRNMRQIPLAGQHEISYYEKFGTPEEKRIAGQYVSALGSLVRDFVSGFKGSASVKEINLANSAKPSKGDMPDTAAGKVESMAYLTRMATERARLTSQYMQKYHVNKLQAEELADKQVNGDQIRQEIHDRLYPKPTEEDINFMASKYKISKDEVKKRLKQKGIL